MNLINIFNEYVMIYITNIKESIKILKLNNSFNKYIYIYHLNNYLISQKITKEILNKKTYSKLKSLNIFNNNNIINISHLQLNYLNCDLCCNLDKKCIMNMKDLKVLKAGISNIDTRVLLNFTNLIFLSLNSFKVKSEHLINLINLKYLFISGVKINNYNFLYNMKNITHFSCSCCYKITDSDLEKINLEKLIYLDISCCNNITDNLIKKCININTLVCSNTKISDDGIKNLNNLEKIIINYCYKITDNGLKYLSKLKEIYCENDKKLLLIMSLNENINIISTHYFNNDNIYLFY